MKSNRVLVVDDERDLVMNLKAALEEKGYEVFTASKGEQAIKAAQKFLPDVMLLDIMMPGMDGCEVCKRIKENPATEMINIIFLTARDIVISKVEGLDIGADDYITKPFNYDELIARVMALCRVSNYRKKLSAMVEFNNVLNVLDTTILKDMLKKHLTDVFDVELFSIFTYHHDTKKLVLFAENHPNSREIRDMTISLEKSPLMKTVINDKKTLYIPDFSKSRYAKKESRNKYHDGFAMGVPLEPSDKVIGIPLEINGEVTGVLNLSGNTKGFFDKIDYTFLSLGAEYIASSISNALAHSKIREFAVRDGLTMLYNHRHFYERLKTEWARSLRYKKPLSIVLADIDYFKKVNDTYGHISGDMALRETARMLNKHVRATDIVARYGGEEFAIILPETFSKEAMVVAERIRKDIESHQFEGENENVRFTISMGVQDSRPSNIKRFEDLVRYADEKLYKAKGDGRNRVVS